MSVLLVLTTVIQQFLYVTMQLEVLIVCAEMALLPTQVYKIQVVFVSAIIIFPLLFLQTIYFPLCSSK